MRSSTPLSYNATTPLYEQEYLHQATGGLLRPGGMGLTTQLIAMADFPEKSVILDVGCGAGHTLQVLKDNYNFSPLGLDPSPCMLTRSSQNAPTVPRVQATAAAIPFPSCCCDGIIAECSLSLTEDMATSLGEMYRVLKPGGKLLLSDIYRKNGSQKEPAGCLHTCINTFASLNEIKTALQEAEFLLFQLQDCTSLLKQLAGQLIFSYGSMEEFWQLFMDKESAKQTCSLLAKVSLGYYALIAEKKEING